MFTLKKVFESYTTMSNVKLEASRANYKDADEKDVEDRETEKDDAKDKLKKEVGYLAEIFAILKEKRPEDEYTKQVKRELD